MLSTIAYIMSQTQTPHEWWKDKADAGEQAAFIESYRSSQRETYSAGWRRNLMLGFLAVGIPLFVRLITV
jgi:hypothetical protein